MHRPALTLTIILVACQTESPESIGQIESHLEVTRTHVAGDVYHYRYVLPVGDGPNAQLHLHRVVREDAPGQPHRTKDAIVLMHGDFATFPTNFLPALGAPPSTHTGVATWLAERDVDVWGIDRRWTRAPRFAPDVSDFDAMGLDQELFDIGASLAFVRGTRVLGGDSFDRVTLAGFSRGGQLAYYYASREALLPAGLRHVKALVPLDIYASLAPEDIDLRAMYCQFAADEYAALAAGVPNIYNVFQLTIGLRALSTPDDRSPWDPSKTCREMMLSLAGETYTFFAATPVYHLNAPVLGPADKVTGLRVSSEDHVARWLAGAAPHQSMRESADTDAILCDPTLFDVPLSRITVPLLSIAAAGGYGERANHSAAQVGSTDVTTLVIRQLPVEREAEDYGHADLLFASDAPTLVWQPLLSWLRAH